MTDVSAPAMNRTKALTVGVFVTAPHGTHDIGPVLATLREQLLPGDHLTVLDGGACKGSLDVSGLASDVEVKHVHRPGTSAFHLRAEIGSMSKRDITVVLEEHAPPSPRFMSEVRRLFGENANVTAIKVLGCNLSSTGGWGWPNFLMAFAECVSPVSAMPPSMLATSAVLRTSVLPKTIGAPGSWETEFIPSLNRQPERLSYSNDVWVNHIEHCGPWASLRGHFNNQRAISAARVASGHRRGKLATRAIKDLGFRRYREIARALANRTEYHHYQENRGKLVMIGWAAVLGALAGAYLGPGRARELMH
jgi:hypothetical protein